MTGEGSEIHRHWTSVEFSPEDAVGLAADPYFDALRSIYSKVAVAQFSVPERAQWDAYRESMWRTQWDFTLKLVASPAFRRQLPELAKSELAESPFVQRSVFHLAGDLTQTLCRGGASAAITDTFAAEDLATSLVRRVLADRRRDVHLLSSDEPWGPWFLDVAWDRTWLVLDWLDARITFIAATDTD